MEERDILLRNLKRHPDRKELRAMLEMLIKIVSNILNHDDPKYRRLSMDNKLLAASCEHDIFTEILIFIGFKKEIHDFKAFWTLPRVSPIQKVKLGDVLSDLKHILDAIPHEPSQVYLDAKQRHERHRAYVEKMLADAEADRLEKLEKEKRLVSKVQRRQQEDAEKLKEEMNLQRIILKNPPTPHFDNNDDDTP